MNRIQIGSDAIVGAGAVVINGIPPSCTAVGYSSGDKISQVRGSVILASYDLAAIPFVRNAFTQN